MYPLGFVSKPILVFRRAFWNLNLLPKRFYYVTEVFLENSSLFSERLLNVSKLITAVAEGYAEGPHKNDGMALTWAQGNTSF